MELVPSSVVVVMAVYTGCIEEAMSELEAGVGIEPTRFELPTLL
jgi:hypothetical protein